VTEPSPDAAARNFQLPATSDEWRIEADLVARTRSGDHAAFGELIRGHLSRAYTLAFRVLRHQEDAEDLVQDAALAALAHFEAFDPSRRFWPWFARIIINRGLDIAAARSVRATEPMPEELASPSASPAEMAERREVAERFRHALALLPPRQQLVVQLFELDGYSVAEIADLLSSTSTAVRWNLHAGRLRLREALGPLRGGDT
jgi:RNA polymerase sigma-70 factor (ECF subfamily)